MLKNPYTVIVFVLTVVVLRVFSITRVPCDLLPIFKTPAVQIMTSHPGMLREVVERDKGLVPAELELREMELVRVLNESKRSQGRNVRAAKLPRM